jgi:hypothetical protein
MLQPGEVEAAAVDVNTNAVAFEYVAVAIEAPAEADEVYTVVVDTDYVDVAACKLIIKADIVVVETAILPLRLVSEC